MRGGGGGGGWWGWDAVQLQNPEVAICFSLRKHWRDWIWLMINGGSEVVESLCTVHDCQMYYYRRRSQVHLFILFYSTAIRINDCDARFSTQLWLIIISWHFIMMTWLHICFCSVFFLDASPSSKFWQFYASAPFFCLFICFGFFCTQFNQPKGNKYDNKRPPCLLICNRGHKTPHHKKKTAVCSHEQQCMKRLGANWTSKWRELLNHNILY